MQKLSKNKIIIKSINFTKIVDAADPEIKVGEGGMIDGIEDLLQLKKEAHLLIVKMNRFSFKHFNLNAQETKSTLL